MKLRLFLTNLKRSYLSASNDGNIDKTIESISTSIITNLVLL